jgi:hypothetical protein
LSTPLSDGHAGADPCRPSWSHKNYVPIKVTNSLILSIPLKYLQYEWVSCRESSKEIAAQRESLAKITGIRGAGFDFFLPDFSGYTVRRLQKPYDVDKVQVSYVVSAKGIGFDPRDPAKLESHQFENELRVLADVSRYRDMYGLRCYEGKTLKSREFCYSANAGEQHKGILLTVDVAPYGPGVINPQVSTEYYSRRYGGIDVDWHTNVKNLAHWREIDAQVWKFMAAWNQARAAEVKP